MSRLEYFLRRALESLVRRPTLTATSVATIFVAVFLTGLFAAMLAGGGRMLAGWAGEVSIAVYLEPGADLAAARAGAQAIAPGRPVEAIPPAAALERLRASMGKDAALLDGVEPGVLPPSLEVGAAGLSLAEVRALAESLRRLPGARDVDDANAWIEGLERVLDGARWAGLVLLLGLAIGTALLVSNTLRLGVFARRDEIEIMKLVGATDAFVQAPFWLEGLLQGLAGALLAVGALIALHASFAARFAASARLGDALDRAHVLPAGLVALLAAGGALLGLLASALAVRRHLRT